jgi:hypothetical protein
MAREQLTFVKIDAASLPEECRELWTDLLQVKAAFKASLQQIAPAGKRVQFVEKYGELKIALATIAAPKAATQSLADYLAQSVGNGHAA